MCGERQNAARRGFFLRSEEFERRRRGSRGERQEMLWLLSAMDTSVPYALF